MKNHVLCFALQSAATVALSLFSFSCCQAQSKQLASPGTAKVTEQPTSESEKFETATFGGGCFWCIEAVYQRVDGVKSVVSGYAGGKVLNPTYEAVCTGETGHAEVCQITFDPSVVTFEQMLAVFFNAHDPTSLNKQGNDRGTQYRSVVFYHNEEQRLATEKTISEMKEDKAYRNKKIFTEVSPLPDFYPAEAYHQNYFVQHPEAGYCRMVIVPKVEKFEKIFKEMSRLQKEKAQLKQSKQKKQD
jgi:peptide-methionine (S)-S-oxide reductase